MTLKIFVRTITSTFRKSHICIVGAGPAGFYAAMHITQHLSNVNIDIIEKLPVPFGLIRYGVAPDHPEVKNVINKFSEVASLPNVKFYGNITLGKDIKLSQLRDHYDAVLLTYGAEEDKAFGIENEDAKNVVAARKFVGWYNGLPNEQDLQIKLDCNTVAILGQGNVALDVARIILTPVDKLRKTDIPEHALATLVNSKVKELYFIGRRGPLQIACTTKELREQLKIKGCVTLWREEDFIGVTEAISNLPRPRKRLTELMLKSLGDSKNVTDHPDSKYFKPIFFRSPSKFLIDNQKQLNGIELLCTKLVAGQSQEQHFEPTGAKEMIACGLAFRSIGYKCVNVDNDIKLGVNGWITNSNGRILDESPNNLGRLYVAGWLATGPIGVILHTMGNAFQVAKNICDDILNDDNVVCRNGFNELRKTILDNKCIVDWQGWKKIDKYEIEEGKKLGKPREKVCSIEKMIEIASKILLSQRFAEMVKGM